jgi:pimeloyl-ACP methyl ester carboxylesterase
VSSTPAPRAAALSLRPSDLRGLYRLGVDGTVGLTGLVEAVHHAISSRIGVHAASPTGATSGITGAVYAAVRGGTRIVGRGVEAALGLIKSPASGPVDNPQREAFIAALNGVFGDHLADSHNPLAIQMALRSAGVALDLGATPLAAQIPEARRKLLVMVHGLCMSDQQWARRGHDHGQLLADEFGCTPLYLHYNSGRHVSQNGREFATLLERAVTRWPVPVEELVIIGHSMGGLVARSACRHAQAQGHAWIGALKKLVFLGTPHHGAPLERGGRQVDLLLGLSPYVAPFARLGKARSAGITDLRYGNLQDADWQGRDRHAQRHDDRQPTPLPEGVATYLLAATTAERAGGLHGKLIGDGLVPVASALGEHRDPALALAVPKSHQHIVTSCGHLDLLCRDEVHAQLRRWLGQGRARSGQRATDLGKAAGDRRDVDGHAELALDLRA